MISTGGGGGGGGGEFSLVLLNVAAPGSRARKGDVVAEFDRQYMLLRLDDYRASVVQWEANIQKLQADLAVAKEAHEQLIRVAKSDLDKARLDLKAVEVLSAIDAEKVKLAAEEAEARHKQVLSEVKLLEISQRAQLRTTEIDRDQAKLELQRAEANADRMLMKAPIDGIVVMQSTWRGGEFGQVQQGDQVRSGQFFMSIVDPSSMVVTASVNQVDSEALRLGMKATVRLDAYPDIRLPATVVGIGAMTKSGGYRAQFVREIPVRLKLDGMDPRVIPDLSASADVVIETASQAPVVPLAAVFNDSGDSFVFLRGPSGWVRKEVELGLTNHVAAAARSGLRKGDVVALRRPI
jgi:multidrug resistance efflux pump